ncbi:MAG: putative cytochrome c5 [bacterium]|nr:MAG: putative cytochrome c5 [bacterium]KAF0148612.1 MAG: putative cytochrome c5 [bacterium]KAF0167916.1 MAG: putative cytochrome c5 [bacterium]TXT20029.1 MAG: putative cytochrome c5 [bacterium]
MKHTSYLSLVLAMSLAACEQRASPPAAGEDTPPAAAPKVANDDDGGRTYQQVCKACHETGVINAPKVGDAAAWAKLLAEGQAIVTAHGWVGVRGMPPRGGRADLSLGDFARATAWMARSAGVDWPNPDEAMLATIRAEEVKRVEALRTRP